MFAFRLLCGVLVAALALLVALVCVSTQQTVIVVLAGGAAVLLLVGLWCARLLLYGPCMNLLTYVNILHDGTQATVVSMAGIEPDRKSVV